MLFVSLLVARILLYLVASVAAWMKLLAKSIICRDEDEDAESKDEIENTTGRLKKDK
jgi:hypothetical protein